jgi:hypothetical protein
MAHHSPVRTSHPDASHGQTDGIGTLWRAFAITVIVLIVMGILIWLMLLPPFID